MKHVRRRMKIEMELVLKVIEIIFFHKDMLFNIFYTIIIFIAHSCNQYTDTVENS